ncbi:MAG: hypothetical protein ACR2J9_10545 [Gaiellales bacterium]
MRIVFSIFLIALVGFCMTTTIMTIHGTTGAFGYCLHYGALRPSGLCPHVPPAVWKTVAVLVPAAFLYLLIAPKTWPMMAVLWFWPVLFVVGSVRCLELAFSAAGGTDTRLILASVGCFLVALIPVIGWRWNAVPREEEREPSEILRGFLLAGVVLVGIVAGFVYISFVS